ncbi:divergent protein kinase domain 1C isoform X1 [Misgurnus anguillicaudatus]|uniref:divergent protein kinase domain 1C isoform X1 n=1 Tax=Misgurnus anguillicaudatus TaxID=75329 RepID=UPI002434D0DC|nr:divergent protein kinase domain 1C [Misgurnus anguillicaudatus]
MRGSLRRALGSARRGCFFRWLGVKVCRRSVLLVVLVWLVSWLFLNGLVFVHRNMFSDFCTDDKSKQILQRVCDDYQQGVLTGDLCEDLCVAGHVEYKRCLYYENGKKVMSANWRGVPVVLKSKLENFSSYEALALLEYQDTAGGTGVEEELSPLDVVFYATLEIKNSLGLETETNMTLPRLWGQRLKEKERTYSRAELASLWALLQQEEYIFLRVLQDLTHHVAKILGSCGHFYAVEFLAAGHAWDQHIFSLEELSLSPSPSPWSGGERMLTARDMVPRVALSFLEMVEHFENDFTHRLHLCDIKPENFAIRKDLTVVAIDVDMAFFEPKMQDILEQNCTSDNDCNFFDCVSKCDKSKNRCGSKRKNSNLQVICEKIFRSWFSPTLLGAKAGLPLQVELQRAVQECAETDGGEDAGRRRAVRQQLQDLLTELIEEDTGSRGEGREHKMRRVHTALNF